MENFDLIQVLLAVVTCAISVYYLVKVIGMCNDVRTIRRDRGALIQFREKFMLYLASGEEEKAKELLIRNIMLHPSFAEAFSSPKFEYTASARKEIMDQFGIYFKALGTELDFDKLNMFYGVKSE